MEILKLYSQTNDGLDILVRSQVVPEVCIQNPKKKFKLRNERTASAQLYPPNNIHPFWHVVDFGEGNKTYSPIDIYMREHNIVQSDFHLAVAKCAQEFGITEELNKDLNRADYSERDAVDGEKNGELVIKLADSMSDAAVRTWGKNVTREHLDELGWLPLASYGWVKDGKVQEYHANEHFPMFVQKCRYIDGNNDEQLFHKIYKPFEYNKAYRFFFKGQPPQGYIYGLDAAKRKYHANGDMKLPAIVIVSGGSDAVNCLSMGYQPVWLGSETADLTQKQYAQLTQIAEEIYLIPDVDATGIREGRCLALQYLEMKTIWLPINQLKSFKDNRGRSMKDLKDYIRLHPSKQDFQLLIRKARCARFWDWEDDGKNAPKLHISLSKLCYMLGLNGFHIIKDDYTKAPRLVRITDNAVEEVTSNDISQFLRKWMNERGLEDYIIDKVMRSRDIKAENLVNNLDVVALDFTSASEHCQWFYFKNCAVEVTADGINKYTFNQLMSDRFFWKDSVIPYDYRDKDKMFKISRKEDGCYEIEIFSTASEVFCFLINASRNYWRKELETRFADNQEGARLYKESHRFCINGEGLTDEEIGEQMQSLVNKIFVVGYLLHRYKMMSRAWAVILYDYLISDSDECNGRSGKSLFGQVVKTLLNVFSIDAKNPRIIDRQFLFAGVTENTGLVFFDECSRYFDYNSQFGRITDGFPVEKKGLDPFTIDFCKSPKLMFATNYVIPNQDSSSIARQLPVLFSDYYHQRANNNDYLENRSVHDDFGHDICKDDYQGWESDIAFFMQCEHFYLSVIGNGEKILPPMDHIDKRQAKQALGKSFEDWAEDYFAPENGHLNVALDELSVYQDYQNEVGKKMAVEKRPFRKKLREFCNFAEHIECYNPMDITGKQKDGERWRKTVNGQKVNYIWVRSKNSTLRTESVPSQQEMEFKESSVSTEIQDDDTLRFLDPDYYIGDDECF